MTIDLFRPFMAQPAVNEAVARVLSYRPDGRLYCGEGELVKEFERRFAALVGADPATVVAVNSCSSALALALQLAGVRHSDADYWDEVISTPMTCTATNEAIVNAGGHIIWADLLPESGLIDPADVARKITPRTKAIMAVDWSGAAANYHAIRQAVGLALHEAGNYAGRHIPIIEDAAHALLTTFDGRPIARRHGDPLSWPNGGDYVAYSLGPIKHLTSGDGGMLVTHMGDTQRARLLRWHGLDRESSADFRCAQTIEEPGRKLHMNDINAAIGLANLPHAEWIVARHRLNAEFYHRALAGLPGVTLPPFDPGSSYWLMGLIIDDRDGFQEYMKAHGVATSRAHRRNDVHPAYHFPNGPLPGVDFFDSHQTNIPVGWWITQEQREHIANAVIEWACFREGWVAA